MVVGWDEDEIDTAIWSKDVRRFTRLHYARYGNGPPGKTPWRGASVEACLKSNGLDGGISLGKTFLTEAQIVHAPKCLWEQYASVPLEDLSLKELAEWVAELQPRSIHDLKPLLLLCQGLLKDVLVEKVDFAEREIERENGLWLAEKQEIIAEYTKVVDGLQSEIERLSKNQETQSRASKLIGRASAYTHNLMMDASRRKLNDRTMSFSEAHRKMKVQCEKQQVCIEDLERQLEALKHENSELSRSNEVLRAEVDDVREDLAKCIEMQQSSSNRSVQSSEGLTVSVIVDDETEDTKTEAHGEQGGPDVEDDSPGAEENEVAQNKIPPLEKKDERPVEISEACTEDTVVEGVSKMIEDMFEGVEGIVFFVDPQPGGYPEFTLSHKRFGRTSSMGRESMGILEEAATRAVYSRKITRHKGYVAVPIQGANELATAIIVVAEESLPETAKYQDEATSSPYEQDPALSEKKSVEAEPFILPEEPIVNPIDTQKSPFSTTLPREASMEWQLPGIVEAEGKTYLPPLSKSAVKDTNIVSKNVHMHADLSNTKLSGVVRNQGNVLGFLTPMGMVVSENGKVVGRVEADGSMRSFTGTAYGEVSICHEKVVRTNGGFPIGYVDDFGKVRDAQSKEIGVEAESGCAVNNSGEVLGWVDPNSEPKQHLSAIKSETKYTRFKGVAKNENGDVVGFITTKHILINGNGATIGTASQNGNVHVLFGNEKEGVCWEPCNVVRSLNGSPLGYINHLGDAVNLAGDVIGNREAGGSIVDENGDEIGWIDLDELPTRLEQVVHHGHTPWAPDKFMVGESGRIVGRVLADGQVVHVDQDNVNTLGDPAIFGKLDEHGVRIDAQGNSLERLGDLTADGHIVDGLGRKLTGVQSFVREGAQKVDMGNESLIGVALSDEGGAMGVITASGLALSITGDVLGTYDPATARVAGREDIIVRMTQVLKDSSGVASAYYNAMGDLVHFDGSQEEILHSEPEWRRGMSFMTCFSPQGARKKWTPQGPGLLADLEGNTIGFVGSNGVARNLEGIAVGKANGDCSVTNEEGEVIGLFVEVIPVHDESGGISGYTFVDGQPISEGTCSLESMLKSRTEDAELKDKPAESQHGGADPTLDYEPDRAIKTGVAALDSQLNADKQKAKSPPHGSENSSAKEDKDQQLHQDQALSRNVDTGIKAIPLTEQYISYASNPVYNIVSDRGEVIGVLGADGVPTDLHGKPVGKVVDHWVVNYQDGSVFGFLEGAVALINKQGNSVGKVVDRLVVGNDQGKVLGIQSGSLIRDLKGNQIGSCMKREPVDKAENPLGQILPVKVFTSMEGAAIGLVDNSSTLVDFEGNSLGKVHGNCPFEDYRNKILQKQEAQSVSCTSRSATEDKEIQVGASDIPNSGWKKKGVALAMLQHLSELAMDRMQEISDERENEMNLLGEEISRLDKRAQIIDPSAQGAGSKFRKAGTAAMFAKELMSVDNTKQRLLTEMEHLQELRRKVLKQLSGKHIAKSFMELRRYRRPPQAVAIAISCTMILLKEKNCDRLKEEALNTIPFSSNAQVLTNIWIELKSYMTPELPKKMQDVDTTGGDETTVRNCQAVEYIIKQLSNEKASRVSQCVVLVRNWVELMLHIFHASQDFRQFMNDDEAEKGN